MSIRFSEQRETEAISEHGIPTKLLRLTKMTIENTRSVVNGNEKTLQCGHRLKT